MKKKAVLREFRGNHQQIADYLEISRQAVHQWPDVVPIKQALALQGYGNLRLNLNDYKKRK